MRKIIFASFLILSFIHYSCDCDCTCMNSNLYNNQNQQVEILDQYSDILTITQDISGQVLQGRNSAYYFKISPGRRYEFHRITLTLNVFQDNTNPLLAAFPNYEQFSLVGKFDIRTAYDSLANNVIDTFATNLLFNTTNGFPVSILKEPLIIDNVSGAPYLTFHSADAGSTFISLTGWTLPPTPPDAILIYCTIKLEGVSYPLTNSTEQNKVQAETDVNNVIDIDI